MAFFLQLNFNEGETEMIIFGPSASSVTGTYVPVAQWHSIVLAAQKVMGSIPREHEYR